ncbi:MAG: VCBS repeat-containing protein [Planctomycetota bacterium]
MLQRSVAALLLLSSAPLAQFDNRWLEFTPSPGSIDFPALDVSSVDAEVDFAWGDLDGDGDIDVVAVRKQPFGTLGKRANALLMNEHGVLRDWTATHATASDLPGDQGFLTPTNDRDAVLADIDQDGFLDVITAVTLSAGEPKHLSHPRVYRSLGLSGGAWLGLRYEDARIPELHHFVSGQPLTPRFTSVAAGDLDGDGFPELYFGDGDKGPDEFGIPQDDAEDRLLRNDGAGYFTDDSLLLMPSAALESTMCPEVAIVDLNGDGANDILKNHGFGFTDLSVVYNDPASPGSFQSYQVAASKKPYGFDLADLNGDGTLDAVMGDNANDFYIYNHGLDEQGHVVWGDWKIFQFLVGGDDGGGTNTRIADFDLDGWPDVLICDVGVALEGFERRTHVYHNPGGAVGAEVQLIEEREDDQLASGGWLGAVGLTEAVLRNTFDAAIFDLDGDGDLDVIAGQAQGVAVWINQTLRNSLVADAASISLVAGGSQGWTLDAGEEHAGELYLVLGTFSGTSPGLPVGGLTIPLNVDGWFQVTANQPGQPPLAGTLGFLDAAGEGAAALALPAGTEPGLAGLLLHHALVTVDPLAGALTSAGTPVPLRLVP